QDAVHDVPLLGYLPADSSIEIPERHLGLLTAKEEKTVSKVRSIGEFFAKHINLDAMLQGVRPLVPENRTRDLTPRTVRTTRLALAHDKAFSFYYHANRMALEEAGAEIIEFSPLADSELPDADVLYIGGGYPELYRHELEANISMRGSVRRFIES